MTATPLRLDDFLPYRLSVTSNLVSDHVAGAYRSLFGLSVPEWRLVAVLAEADGLSQAAIGERTRMDKVSVSRAARALEGRGLVTRLADARDARARALSLTDAGRGLHALVAPRAKAMEAAIFACLDPAEATQLKVLLARVEASLTAADPTAGSAADKK
ncbi:MarR family transcriptional regulator [Polymorphobacter multimanifer]|uniref:DNA-binding MarR family transcriptional regulator n=1 Tax=Polymorphobacter multimanifer TaxID=1070431 RepID=A0A841L7G1_9SPHN|nr:MarR family transcriptional regulator [Polymorphobacter multimanifer]MBB6227521.1 DNA-binding MarR family transcriptional regulator [Polymorphobacter multimanifer]GGI84594.1 MarR family transcriptional regulator [Polymorphobacter multimanifer]